MAVEETVVWSRSHAEAGCVIGAALGLVAGMFVSFPLLLVLPDRWAWLAFVPFVVLPGYGAVRGRFDRRAEVVRAELTSRRIVLENAVDTRVVEAAELVAVDVHHRGHPGTGYETLLSLAFAGRPVVRIPGRYDPELAPRLRRLFGAAVEVRERHEELVPPSTG